MPPTPQDTHRPGRHIPPTPPSGYLGRVSANAEPGVGQPESVLDTAVMRAMAHPARLALLEHLRNGPATATECAGVVGLSPSATSYHLLALARAGLVEAAPGRGDGRERLWRITAGRYAVTGVADLAPEGSAAYHALLESLLAWDDVRIRRYLPPGTRPVSLTIRALPG